MASQGSAHGNKHSQRKSQNGLEGKKTNLKRGQRPPNTGARNVKKHRASGANDGKPDRPSSQSSGNGSGSGLLAETQVSRDGVPNTLVLQARTPNKSTSKAGINNAWDGNSPVTPNSSVSGSAASASDAWIQCEKNAKTAEERQADLQRFVRTTLFKNLKMITNEQMMFYQSEPKTFCQETCKAMHVKPEFKQHWWNSNVKVIAKAINGRRSDVTQAMKKAFMGESNDVHGTSCVAMFWWSVMISLQMDQRFVTMMAGKCC